LPEVDEPPPVRALLDQNTPPSPREWLQARKPSWEVVHTYDVGLRGRSDEEIFDWVQQNGHLIVTFDVGFADTQEHLVEHNGVIRLRVSPTTADEAGSALERLFAEVDDSILSRSLVIVRRSSIRVIPRGIRESG
jgi:predicted nuclease of predicted toxin-antitoxin system